MITLPVQPVLLVSDLLLFILTLVLGLAGWHAHRSGTHRAGWLRVFQRPAAMCSVVVLSVFFAVALADSLHFRERLPDQPGRAATYANEPVSVLDKLLTGLQARREKTYSEPFAYQSLAKESVRTEAGLAMRSAPRLLHGGAHLADPARERLADIAIRMFGAVVLALAIGGGLTIVLAGWLGAGRGGLRAGLRRLRQPDPERDARWDVLLWTLWAILLLACLLSALAPYYHVLGTDKVGQDVLYLSLKGIRTAVLIGTLTTLVMLPLALALGIMAGYFGGWIDDLIQYVYTLLNAIPGVLLIAAAVLMIQVAIDAHPDWFASSAERADLRLVALCLILGMTSWTGLCRLLRGEALKLREQEHVLAARAFDVPDGQIMRRHILPNTYHIVLITMVMDFSGLVLAEAVLSYVGIGVDPATHSFGSMINAARMELARDPVVWWSLGAAFCFMLALVLPANLLADAVRDAFDPRRVPH